MARPTRKIAAALTAGAIVVTAGIFVLTSRDDGSTPPAIPAAASTPSPAQRELNTKNEIRQLKAEWQDVTNGNWSPANGAEFQNHFVFALRRAVEYPDAYTPAWVQLAHEITDTTPFNPASAGWQFDHFVQENYPELAS
jgi:hypothetical protein